MAVDPQLEAMFAAQWNPESKDRLDFAATVDQVFANLESNGALAGGVSRAPVEVAGSNGVRISYSVAPYGTIVQEVTAMYVDRGPDRVVRLIVAAGPHRLSQSFVDTVLGSVALLSTRPAGTPLRFVRDERIQEFLQALGPGRTTFTGDAMTLDAYSVLTDMPLFPEALASVPEFATDREVFRGGYSLPHGQKVTEWAEVYVVRSAGPDRPNWAPLIEALEAEGVSKVGPATCEAYRGTGLDGVVRLAVVVEDEDLFVEILGTSADPVAAASKRLGLCA